ncbi:MAG: 2-amino-4-oxopentanoate thiolase subunit OrtB [Eubacteriales bacterium]|nr:2-amino-4-oxopentanoate thiolase subunit OrtB [Eubacteriales bacterium]MDD4389231.1 2-amino-4-oxopentanoate thiolase subunit OrtB [Eubacteriales bacterium]
MKENKNLYEQVMSRREEILNKALGVDFDKYEIEGIAFDYEKYMEETAYSLEEVAKIQKENGVGNTPLIELKNITALARKYAPEGKGARIFIKDEACNISGSFKERRASISAYHAKKKGYKGVIAATSGNYGAAVAAQAAKQGLDCIVIQECYDSNQVGQPEIIEKARKCEALGAEVIQTSVGPELFFEALQILDETGFFNASLYSSFGIAGVETLGQEIAVECMDKFNKYPEAVVCTNAGGGNLTGTARGLIKSGASETRVIAASVNLKGLHMASDNDFNRKSFTTGHTGFGIPYATYPDRSDVLRSAARPLRYMDEYYLVEQGEVFYVTEMLAQMEGMERGPAGNTSLSVAFKLAQRMDEDEIIVVQETEYTGAGKHINPQLSFARKNGIDVKFGDPKQSISGKNIILPHTPKDIDITVVEMDVLKKSYLRTVLSTYDKKKEDLSSVEFKYLTEELNVSEGKLNELLSEI